ncbi:AMP-binding protein [Nostoc sp. WHI]|uniref:AMP-binding protein n=1 Tax=Nostoc sp. WHI TaxID=2650611 RepID=UPI0018C78498|nr:AMP-binding protein [Nostoc sp. WHI]MBG1271050.1 fatty acyl-AMP ligase [Nostoc sp. WHI]
MTIKGSPQDLLAVLKRAAEYNPTRGIRLFQVGQEVEYLLYQQLYQDVGRIASSLKNLLNITPGERIGVILPTSADFVRAFFGVIAAGGVPVTLPAPFRFSSSIRYVQRIYGALTRSQIHRVLGDKKLIKILGEASGCPDYSIQVLTVSNLLLEDFTTYSELVENNPAFIQYTSGSTSDPKGVILTHKQILANLEAIRHGLKMEHKDVVCTWLPMFHDMGLVGCLLSSIYTQIDLLLMAPDDFIRNPLYWLKLFEPYQATLSPAPNSAYLRCAEQIKEEDIKTLDLSSWRSAMNGSEQIDSLTTKKFIDKFQIAGFHPEAMMPVYGLAEATLAVTFPPIDRGIHSVFTRRSLIGEKIVDIVSPDNPDAKEVISVGYPVKGIEICLFEDNGTPISTKNKIGEICIRGDSVTKGYDFDEQATNSAFREGWFATGDLGFFHQDELYITGRRKEVIIVHGQNYYAHDIELVVKELEGFKIRNAMAISVENKGTESLVLFVVTNEVDTEKRKQFISIIREAVSLSLGISPLDVIFLKQNEIPLTSSGKLERHKGLQLYESHTKALMYLA